MRYIAMHMHTVLISYNTLASSLQVIVFLYNVQTVKHKEAYGSSDCKYWITQL